MEKKNRIKLAFIVYAASILAAMCFGNLLLNFVMFTFGLLALLVYVAKVMESANGKEKAFMSKLSGLFKDYENR